jgi:hypothetical protein
MTSEMAVWLNYSSEFMRRDGALAVLEDREWLLQVELRAVRAEIRTVKPARDASLRKLLKINEQLYEKPRRKK